jgi:hypothetical protein
VALFASGQLDAAEAAGRAAAAAPGPHLRISRLLTEMILDLKGSTAASAAGNSPRVDALWCSDNDGALHRATEGAMTSCAAAAAEGGCGKLLAGAPRSPPRLWCRESCNMCGAQLEQQLKPGWTAYNPATVPVLFSSLDLDFGESRTQGGNGEYGGSSSNGGGGGGGDSGGDVDEDPCDFDRIDGLSVTAAAFHEKHVVARQPVVLSGLTREWEVQARINALHAGGGAGSAGGAAAAAAGKGGGDRVDGDPGENIHTGAARTGQAYVRSMLGAAVLEGTNSYMNLDRQPRAPSVRAALLLAYSTPSLFGVDLLDTHCFQDLPNRWMLFSGAGSGSAFHIGIAPFLAAHPPLPPQCIVAVGGWW